MKRIGTAVILLLSLTTCKTVKRSSETSSANLGEESKGLKLCYGYRGNGTSVFATIGGIARMIDQFGPANAIVGTSSGSVAAFLSESVLMRNPSYDCESCSEADASERRSFMLKGFPLAINAFSESEGMSDDLAKVKRGKEIYDFFMESFIHPSTTAKTEASPSDGDSPVRKVLTVPYIQELLGYSTLVALKAGSNDIKNMINPEFYKVVGIGGTAHPEMIQKIIENFLSFQGLAKENKFSRQNLMYPGIVNFDFIFTLIGHVGDWYAGYGPQYPRKELSQLLDSCAKSSRTQWWNAIAEKKYGASTCGQEYYKLFKTYFNARKKSSTGPRRIDDMMGSFVPAFVSTSAIGGNNIVDAMNAAADKGAFESIDALSLKRENFSVLYFGSEKYKNTINNKKSMYQDVVTKSIVSMGSVSWLKAMKASGQEPAVDRSQTFTENGQRYLAMGGFVDQLQSKFLNMIGCESSVFINTNYPILNFANRYAPKTWNEDKNLVNDLFDPDSAESSESIGYSLAESLLCSRWSAYGLKEVWEMADNSYHEIIFTRNKNILEKGADFKNAENQVTTRNEIPKTCYSLEEKRNNRYGPYKP